MDKKKQINKKSTTIQNSDMNDDYLLTAVKKIITEDFKNNLFEKKIDLEKPTTNPLKSTFDQKTAKILTQKIEKTDKISDTISQMDDFLNNNYKKDKKQQNKRSKKTAKDKDEDTIYIVDIE